jgi:hypothetical protein
MVISRLSERKYLFDGHFTNVWKLNTDGFQGAKSIVQSILHGNQSGAADTVEGVKEKKAAHSKLLGKGKYVHELSGEVFISHFLSLSRVTDSDNESVIKKSTMSSLKPCQTTCPCCTASALDAAVLYSNKAQNCML